MVGTSIGAAGTELYQAGPHPIRRALPRNPEAERLKSPWMKVYGGVPPAPLMAQAFWNTKSTSRVGFGIRQALVIGFLCALVFGGLQLGTSTNIRAPPVTISRTQAQVSGVDRARRSHPVIVGGCLAAGVSMTCSGTGASAVSCSTPRSAQPRPAISANDTWINITKSLVGGPTSTPGAMYLGVMDYDAYDGYIMYFGGSPNGVFLTSHLDLSRGQVDPTQPTQPALRSVHRADGLRPGRELDDPLQRVRIRHVPLRHVVVLERHVDPAFGCRPARNGTGGTSHTTPT